MRVFYLVLCLVALPASAQTVQKCIDGKGHVTLTSGACPAGQRESASYDATPERVTAEQLRRQAELREWQRQQDAARRSAGTTHRVYTSPGQDPKRQRCEAARQWRQAQADRVGLKRTHDMLRRWDEHVRRECK